MALLLLQAFAIALGRDQHYFDEVRLLATADLSQHAYAAWLAQHALIGLLLPATSTDSYTA